MMYNDVILVDVRFEEIVFNVVVKPDDLPCPVVPNLARELMHLNYVPSHDQKKENYVPSITRKRP